MHGPYDSTSPSHNSVNDPVVSQSALCGQCHQVFNPVIHRAGTTRPFPLDTTYSEWLQSTYASGAQARTCQNCHMEVQQGSFVVAKDSSVNGPNPAEAHLRRGERVGPGGSPGRRSQPGPVRQ